ncbi:hypothetical protein KUCAC02_023744, partial [Chaenocephalus aceratus]
FKPRRAAPSSRLSVVHGPVVALMLTGREEAPGDEGTQTTRIYGGKQIKDASHFRGCKSAPGDGS